MAHHENNSFVKGALIGGALASAIALLMAPKSGKELRADINNTYEDLSEKTHKFTDKIKHGNFLGAVEDVEESTASNFLIGSALGALLGAAATLMVAPKSGVELREDLTDAYEGIRDRTHDTMEQIDDWKNTIGKAAEKLHKSHGKGHSKFADVMDWANVGMHLWQEFQKRR